MSLPIALDDLKDIEARECIFADLDSAKARCDSSASNLESANRLDLDPEDYEPVNHICNAAKSLIAAWQASNRLQNSNIEAHQSQYFQFEAVKVEHPPRRFHRASSKVVARKETQRIKTAFHVLDN